MRLHTVVEAMFVTGVTVSLGSLCHCIGRVRLRCLKKYLIGYVTDFENLEDAIIQMFAGKKILKFADSSEICLLF